jgi:CheY-like chemotaxis protein
MSGKHILVVDDEASVIESLRMTLTHYGYAVDTAASAQEALEKLQAAAYRLVVTDRKMPNMTGDQLAACIRRTWPRLPVIMLTGYPPEAKPPGVDAVLLKPFSTAGLRATIEGLLQSRGDDGERGSSSHGM